MPVVLLHDVEHQQSLLLDGGTELEECRLHILRTENGRDGGMEGRRKGRKKRIKGGEGEI